MLSAFNWMQLLLLLVILVKKCENQRSINDRNPRSKLTTLFQWSQVEYDYEPKERRSQAIKDGTFSVGKIVIIDADYYYAGDATNNKLFVTTPKLTDGIPATLGTVTNRNLNGNPIIRPYPDWSWHRNLHSCQKDRLVSTFRIAIDECGFLWLVDTGKVGDYQICPAQILAFDLNTNKVVHRYEIPQQQLEPRSVLVDIIADTRNFRCFETFIYIADCQTYSLIVYDLKSYKSWRITDKTFYPYPSFGTYNIAGIHFHWMDGVFGLALTPFKSTSTDRVLMYHAMSSGTENWVLTSHIRNASRFLMNSQSSPEIFHTFKKTRKSQSGPEVIDRNGVLLFATMHDMALHCWRTDNTEFIAEDSGIIAKNETTMQFVSGLKIVNNIKGEQELWMLSNRYQKFVIGNESSNEINFRIQAGSIKHILANSKCSKLQ